MYLSLLGKPSDDDLERYPSVHPTGPHEWDPSALDFTYPSGDGEPLGPMTLMRYLPLTLILMNLEIIPIDQSKLSIFWMTDPDH